MASLFVFDIIQIRHILHGLRKLREVEPQNQEAINGVICCLKYQMIGKLKQLEPFMRNPKWIKDEIDYEQDPKNVDYHECTNEACKKPAHGKFCVDCWYDVLAEIHGVKEHEKIECKSA